MEMSRQLAEVVGLDNLLSDFEALENYSRDYSLRPPRLPNFVVRPQNAMEVQRVVQIAREWHMPVVPCSSGVHFHGSAIPVQGGIVIDLRRMSRVLEIDKVNRKARIEPGVT